MKTESEEEEVVVEKKGEASRAGRERETKKKEAVRERDPVWDQDPLSDVIRKLAEIRKDYEKEKNTLGEICEVLGDMPLSESAECIRTLLRERDSGREESQLMREEIESLKNELTKQKEESEQGRKRPALSNEDMARIREYAALLAKVLNKA